MNAVAAVDAQALELIEIGRAGSLAWCPGALSPAPARVDPCDGPLCAGERSA